MLARLFRKQDGVAALEMALIFPVITVVLFLIMDFGLFFFDYVGATNAVREGARCGAVGHAAAVVATRVAETSGFGAPSTVDVDRTGGQIGDDIVVTATYDHDWILPAEIFGVPATFTVSSTMRLETDATTNEECG